jgi:hypothetical protein
MGLNCAHAVHCITEAVRRLAAAGEAPYASEWLFDRESPLGKLMLADIAAGDYETAQQEAAEREPDGSGGYDFQTAVNEWVHQWCAATSATRSDIPAPSRPHDHMTPCTQPAGCGQIPKAGSV